MIFSNDILCEIIKHCDYNTLFKFSEAFDEIKQLLLDPEATRFIHNDSKCLVRVKEELLKKEIEKLEKHKKQLLINYINDRFKEFMYVDGDRFFLTYYIVGKRFDFVMGTDNEEIKVKIEQNQFVTHKSTSIKLCGDATNEVIIRAAVLTKYLIEAMNRFMGRLLFV